MIKTLFSMAIVAVAVIIGLNWYLQPDDLTKCGESPSSVSGCQSVDMIVAISGGDTKARANAAVSLYKNGWANKLVFSGAAQDKTGPSNAAAMKAIAIAASVPASDIILDEYSETTKQNAQNAQTIFSENNVKSIILVTSGYHQRRAYLEFEKSTTGITILNHPVKTDSDWSFWWWLTPRGWWLASSEMSKIAFFYVTGLWS